MQKQKLQQNFDDKNRSNTVAALYY